MFGRFKNLQKLCVKRDITVALDMQYNSRVVLKRYKNEEYYRNELQNLERIRNINPLHPNSYLVRHIEGCPEDLTIIFPYIRGRDMLDNLTWMRKYQHRNMSERESRDWMDKAFSCISALQNRHLVHLDIKLENFVMTPHIGRKDDLTLIDVQTLGSVRQGKYGKLSYNCGTYLYQSPETNLRRQYHINTDLWGLGLCGYIICQGTHPFQRSDINYRNVQSFVYDNLEFMSDEYRARISSLLSADTKERTFVPFEK
jgi:serine/threonine protein kinase